MVVPEELRFKAAKQDEIITSPIDFWARVSDCWTPLSGTFTDDARIRKFRSMLFPIMQATALYISVWQVAHQASFRFSVGMSYTL